MPSYYLNQYWNVVNWALGYKLQWNLNRNPYIFILKKYIWKCLENGGHFIWASVCLNGVTLAHVFIVVGVWVASYTARIDRCSDWCQIDINPNWTHHAEPIDINNEYIMLWHQYLSGWVKWWNQRAVLMWGSQKLEMSSHREIRPWDGKIAYRPVAIVGTRVLAPCQATLILKILYS